MKSTYFLSWAFGILAAAGPVVTTSCPQQCYTATNECGMAYGGCWDECPGTTTEIPTFTRPLCSPTAATAGGSALPEVITPAAAFPAPTPPSGGCPGQTICVDAKTMCGNQTVLYGGCYDMCTPSLSPTAPLCTLAPVVTDWLGSPNKTTTSSRPKKSRGPCTRAKAWMCAPAGW